MPTRSNTNQLIYQSLGIDTHQEMVVYLRADSHVVKSEGFEALTRIIVKFGKHAIIATLNIVRSELLQEGEVSLSESAAHRLGIKQGQKLSVAHLQPILSMSHVRSKIYGNRIPESAFKRIIKDIVTGRYSNIYLSAFVTACAGDNLEIEEITGLTQAMVASGTVLKWPQPIIMDKHCVGGLPGNRTTPIVVSIVSAAGLRVPKTSSWAITSPAGTADVMNTLTRVNLTKAELQSVMQQTGACMISGSKMQLSPADDLINRVERALDIDSEGQMIASVLSKKAAAGSTHVVIDIPVGPTAKVRTEEQAEKLKYYFRVVGKAIGLHIKTVISDGSQPVGRGIGPALEAQDVLAVLGNDPHAPQDLRQRALRLAGLMLEMGQAVPKGQGDGKAQSILEEGKAFQQFMAICKAQGGFTNPGHAAFQHDILARKKGTVKAIDNRKLALVAKLAGAPQVPEAGLEFFAPIGKAVSKGEVLLRVHAQSKGELAYALNYAQAQESIIQII